MKEEIEHISQTDARGTLRYFTISSTLPLPLSKWSWRKILWSNIFERDCIDPTYHYHFLYHHHHWYPTLEGSQCKSFSAHSNETKQNETKHLIFFKNDVAIQLYDRIQ